MLAGRTGARTEVVPGDVLDLDSLDQALQGVDTAFYLVHSMGSAGSFEETDRQAAQNFSSAARRAGVRRIIYLGGLGDSEQPLSAHLRSRHEVGETLRSSGVQVIEFRASIVIGSGSLSFEMVRALVERLPIMIAPRWVSVLSQPIGVSDLLQYLVAAIELDDRSSRIFEIGGADRVSYGDLMREYARQRGLRRLIIPVPVLTPRLSSLWLGLVTPLYARVGRKLIDSICYPTVVRDPAASTMFAIVPVGYREAIRAALGNEDQEFVESRWSDALSAAGEPAATSGRAFGSRLVDSRTVQVPCAATQLFAAVQRIGGTSGWYFSNWLWNLQLRQTAIFDPRGLLGRAYWYLVYPLHQLVFAGMLRSIAAASHEIAGSTRQSSPPTASVQWIVFLFFLALCFGTAAIGASWTSSSVNGWYQTLARPTWTPPDWVFGPVWTVLYFLMAVSAWLVWRTGAASAGTWVLFASQLLLNAAWSGIFFAVRSPGAAFVEILFLWAAIAATALAFRSRSKLAGWLLLPYLAWSSFAAALNLAIWRLNA